MNVHCLDLDHTQLAELLEIATDALERIAARDTIRLGAAGTAQDALTKIDHLVIEIMEETR